MGLLSWFRKEDEVRKPLWIEYRFDPKPDITAFEMAVIWGSGAIHEELAPFEGPLYFHSDFRPKQLFTLRGCSSAARHFEVV